MSNNKDYAAKLEAANSLPKDQIKEPYIPVGIYLQEAEDLYHWCKEDKEKLLEAGLAESKLNDLPVLSGACREAQSIWNKVMQTREDAEQRWVKESPGAFDFQDQLIHTFKYAFRKEPSILNRVNAIAQGNGNADMIQDLNDLAVLGHAYPELLKAKGFKLIQLDKAANLSDRLASVLAEANGDRNSSNGSKLIRDRMYTLLKETVDEIRECGKYVFWKDEDRSKGYASAYLRRLRMKQNRISDVEEEYLAS